MSNEISIFYLTIGVYPYLTVNHDDCYWRDYYSKNSKDAMHRNKVQELYSKEYSQKEISQILLIGLATINRDIPLVNLTYFLYCKHMI
jgi:hypothetical protein